LVISVASNIAFFLALKIKLKASLIVFEAILGFLSFLLFLSLALL
jgi:hypothetical protein